MQLSRPGQSSATGPRRQPSRRTTVDPGGQSRIAYALRLNWSGRQWMMADARHAVFKTVCGALLRCRTSQILIVKTSKSFYGIGACNRQSVVSPCGHGTGPGWNFPPRLSSSTTTNCGSYPAMMSGSATGESGSLMLAREANSKLTRRLEATLDEVLISGNPEGLRTLGPALLALAGPTEPSHFHIHMDQRNDWLAPGSIDIIIDVMKDDTSYSQ